MPSILTTLMLLTGGSGAPAPAGPTYLLLSPDTRQMTHAGKPVPPERVNLRVFRQVSAGVGKTVWLMVDSGELFQTSQRKQRARR